MIKCSLFFALTQIAVPTLQNYELFSQMERNDYSGLLNDKKTD